MALCDKCAFMNDRYDEFRQSYNDAVPVNESMVQHFCPMYDDHIPNEIYYGGGECEFFQERIK